MRLLLWSWLCAMIVTPTLGWADIDAIQATTVVAADAGSFVRLSPGTSLTLTPNQVATCTLFVKNVGQNTWTPGGAYLARSVNSAGTAAVASPLAYNWRSGSTTDITTPTLSVLGEGGTANATNSCRLQWTAPGDDGHIGQASMYDVRWSGTALVSNQWLGASRYVFPGVPRMAGQTDTVRVTNLHADSLYWFSVRAADEYPNWADWSNVVSHRTATATGAFPFTIKAPATTGTYTLHLALYNSSTQYFTGRLVTLTVTVGTTPVIGSGFLAVTGKFDAGSFADIALYEPANGNWHRAINGGQGGTNSFTPDATLAQTDVGAGNGFHPLTGDFNGDGRWDIGLYVPSTGRWYASLSDGHRFVWTPGPGPGGCWKDQFGAGVGFSPFTGDFNGDGKWDIGLYDPSTGRWYVCLSDGTKFNWTPGPGPGGCWMNDFGAGTGLIPTIADFNGDGKTDIGFYYLWDGRWWACLSDGARFNWTPGPGPGGSWKTDFGAGNGFHPLAGDFNGDSKGDIGFYDPSTGRWYVCLSDGTKFNWTPGPGPGGCWKEQFGAGVGLVPITNDFNADGKWDIGFYDHSTGRWYVSVSDGTKFNWTPGPGPGGCWVDQFGRNTSSGASGIVGVDDPVTLFEPLTIWPNPYRTKVTLAFALPAASDVRIEIYDLSGRLVGTPADGHYRAGRYTIAWSDRTLPSGMYFARLQTRYGQQTVRVVRVN